MSANGLHHLRVGGRGLTEGAAWEQGKLKARKMLENAAPANSGNPALPALGLSKAQVHPR